MAVENTLRLKKRGEPVVEALRNEVCKALLQLEEQILSV